jgi:hypothetical protein
MALYMDHVVVEKNNPEGAYPERKHFLRALVRELDVAHSDSLPRERLYECDKLKGAVQNPQRDSPYVQLLELGVLLEEWDGEHCLVRFAFDRLFEYLLAEHLDPHIDSAADVLNEGRRALDFKNLRGALVMILLRACRDGRHQLVVDSLDLCDSEPHSEPKPERQTIVAAVCDLLEQLARSGDASFEVLLKQIPQAPGRTDVSMLLSLYDRLQDLGHFRPAEMVAHGGRRSHGPGRRRTAGQRPHASGPITAKAGQHRAGDSNLYLGERLRQGGWR